MRQKILNRLGYVLLLGISLLLVAVFWPRHYQVPELKKRNGIQYWNLPTGSKIAYTLIPASSPKKNVPVLYLHGGPGGPIREANIDALSPLADDGYDVYLYDQIGGGFSDRLKDIEEYTAERHKRDLEEIVKITGAEKVIIIAQSWGAILATLFAADNPEKVEKIIFTCPGPMQPIKREYASTPSPDSLHLRAPYFSNAQGNKKANNLRAKAMSFMATAFGIKLASDEEADAFSTHLNQALNRSLVCDTTKTPKATGGSGFYVSIMTLNSLDQIPDPRPKLKQAPFPVLVLKGQCDNQKWGFTNEYLEVFPKHQLVVIPDAGHAISIEQPEVYINTIRSFLNQNSGF